MKYVVGYPPNIEEIKKHFTLNPDVVFTYGETVYVPNGQILPEHLEAHEGTHVKQQAAVGGPEKWWARYFKDVKFRLEQELAAYIEQYKVISASYTRREKQNLLKHITTALSSALYGEIIKRKEAEQLLLQAVDN